MSMVCKWSEKENIADEDIRTCLILSDETPATMPIDGTNVFNLPDTAAIGGGSVLIDLSKSEKYIMGNDGETWHKWG